MFSSEPWNLTSVSWTFLLGSTGPVKESMGWVLYWTASSNLVRKKSIHLLPNLELVEIVHYVLVQLCQCHVVGKSLLQTGVMGSCTYYVITFGGP